MLQAKTTSLQPGTNMSLGGWKPLLLDASEQISSEKSYKKNILNYWFDSLFDFILFSSYEKCSTSQPWLGVVESNKTLICTIPDFLSQKKSHQNFQAIWWAL